MRIPVSMPILNSNEKKYVNECLDTTWISSNGKFIAEFEKRFAEFTGYKHAIATSNGTVALHLILLALGLKPGDEVITPTLSYIATANSITYTGAKTVFIDSEENTCNIDVNQIEKLITKKTKAILPVHLYGHSADLDPILKLAKKYNLYVIEDAAEAIGTYYKGKHVGGFGQAGMFSFFGNKTLTTGEGGMIVTDNDELAAQMRLLKGQGMDPKRRYWHPIVGYNYRMTNIQAAIGLAQIENIEWRLKRRQEVAEWYYELLKPLTKYIELPTIAKYTNHSFWMFNILLKDNVKISRDELMNKLGEEGIETRPIFYPMHTMPPYFENKKYLIAEKLSAKGISIPTHSGLTKEEVEYVVEKLSIILQ